jgi:hypothetical protein
MVTLEWEIIRPETVDINGRTVAVAGLSSNGLKTYLTLTPKALPSTLDFHLNMGLPDSIDTENPDVDIYKGLCVEAVLASEEAVQRRELSEAELESGMKPEQAEVLKDEDGNPIKAYYPNILTICGRSKNQVA